MHTIRLAGPWSVVRGDAPPRTVRMPAAWEAVFTTPGTATFTRRFNRPPHLAVETRVWLRIDEYGGRLSVSLDGRFLCRAAEGEAVRVELGDLSPSPVLSLTISVGNQSPPTGLYGPVLLEFEDPNDADAS